MWVSVPQRLPGKITDNESDCRTLLRALPLRNRIPALSICKARPKLPDYTIVSALHKNEPNEILRPRVI